MKVPAIVFKRQEVQTCSLGLYKEKLEATENLISFLTVKHFMLFCKVQCFWILLQGLRFVAYEVSANCTALWPFWRDFFGFGIPNKITFHNFLKSWTTCITLRTSELIPVNFKETPGDSEVFVGAAHCWFLNLYKKLPKQGKAFEFCWKLGDL